MASNKEINNTADTDFIITTTSTIDKLFSISPDSVTLYMFYIKTSKWQRTNQVFTTNTYGMKCLSWGSKRYSEAKKVLEEEGLITIKQKRDNKGRITGYYVKINYLFKQKTIQDISNPEVDGTGPGQEETNALSTNTINALSINIPLTEGEDSLLVKLPDKYGKTPLLRLGWAYKSLWYKIYGTKSTLPYGRFGKAIKSLLIDHSEMQIAVLLYTYFHWYGGDGRNENEHMFISNAGFPIEMMVKKTDLMVAYLVNNQSLAYDDSVAVKQYAVRVLKDIL